MEKNGKLSCWRRFCGWALRKLGWTAVEPPVPEAKAVILGVPHTSVWDFVISYLYYESVGGTARIMIKKEFFFPPLGWLLRALGAIPVDRSSPAMMLRSVMHEMERSETFHLALAPEGTRKPVKVWKTGFHLIARNTGAAVYMGYFDWKTKRIGRGQKVEITDDSRADMKRIQALYEGMALTGKHPEMYITH